MSTFLRWEGLRCLLIHETGVTIGCVSGSEDDMEFVVKDGQVPSSLRIVGC